MGSGTSLAVSFRQSSRIRRTDGLVIGAWAGLVSGLLEGVITYATRFAPVVVAYRKSSELALWLTPLAYAACFAAAAVLLVPLPGSTLRCSTCLC